MQGIQEEDNNVLVECGICLQVYVEGNKPVRFKACMHTVCQNCAKNLIRTNQKKCPFDRKAFSENDVIVDLSLWEIIKAFISQLITGQENATQQVKAKYADLKPTLQTIIGLRKALIAYYKRLISQTDYNNSYCLASNTCKTVYGVLCLNPISLPFGLFGLGIHLVADTVSAKCTSNDKKEAIFELSDVIDAHDKLSNSSSLRDLLLFYLRMKQAQYIMDRLQGQKLKAKQVMQASEFAENFGWVAGTTIPISLGYTVYNAGKTTATSEEGYFTTFGNGFQNLRKSGISGLTKSIVIVGTAIEWGAFYFQWKEGKATKEELEKLIKATEVNITSLEAFMQELNQLQ